MKKIRMISLLLSLVMALGICPCYVSAEETMQTRVPRIFVMGDSMAASYPAADYPRMGWGQALQNYFDEDELLVANRAVAGASSRNFYNDPYKDDPKQSDWHCWSTIWGNYPEDPADPDFRGYLEDENLLQAGDYVIFTFGANDVKKDDEVSDEDLNASPTAAWNQRNANPTLSSDSEYVEDENGVKTYSYKWYMKNYVELIRSRGAVPIIITPPERRVNPSNKQHAVASTIERYEEAIKELAVELNGDADASNDFICLTDVSDLTLALYSGLGDTATGSQKLFLHLAENQYPSYDGGAVKADNTHFRDFGAVEVSGIIVEELLKHDSSELDTLKSAMKTVSTPVIYDQDHNTAGTAIKMTKSKAKNQTLYPRAQFINKENEATTVQVIMAGYDSEGKMTEIISKDEFTVPAQSVESFDTVYTMPNYTHAGKIKMFVWKDFDSLVPHGDDLYQWTFTAGATSDYPVFEETFDDYSVGATLNDWTKSDAMTVTPVVSSMEQSPCLYLPSFKVGTSNAVAYKSFTATPVNNESFNVIFECDVILGNFTYLELRNTGSNAVFKLYATTSDVSNVDYRYDEAKGKYLDTYDSIGVKPNEKFHLKAVIKGSGNKADIYINNSAEPVLADIGIYNNRAANTTAQRIYLTTMKNQTTKASYVDNISIYRQKIETAN